MEMVMLMIAAFPQEVPSSIQALIVFIIAHFSRHLLHGNVVIPRTARVATSRANVWYGGRLHFVSYCPAPHRVCELPGRPCNVGAALKTLAANNWIACVCICWFHCFL